MQEPTPSDLNAVEEFLIKRGIDIGFLISGFFGALLLVSKNSAQRISTTIASILSGAACANYLTPVVMNYMPESIKLNGKYAVAFIMGFLGLKGLELILTIVFARLDNKSKTKEDVKSKKPKKPKKPRRG
jgi:hypothetical protein